MKLLMLGPPGSGKGTQGERLARELGVEHVSSGELLRREVGSGSALGREVEEYVEAGRLAPDELVTRVVRGAVAGLSGYVLDGYPRTVQQADGFRFDAVVLLDVPEDEVRRRMASRGRGDDTPEVIDERLREYEADTRPLAGHYRDVLVEVDGNRPEDEIAAELARRIKA
jgi:adenylate kinase